MSIKNNQHCFCSEILFRDVGSGITDCVSVGYLTSFWLKIYGINCIHFSGNEKKMMGVR